jgi:hypothetical protein
MEDILALLDAFQQAACDWQEERVLGFNDPGRIARENEMVEIKTALIEAILKISG